ncbi:MAG TPA: 4Fe-4S dicluster domain-containing protein [Bacteroidota bacterium]|nr:4Fe-4S dicluster domain-containing protein [Bacteroidota bacterium]
MQPLKKIRVVAALVFLFLTTAVFLDFTGRIPAIFTRTLVSLQVVPSLIRLASGVTLTSLALLFVLLLTLLFGRVYCSTLCPLGTLQDIVIRLSGRVRRRRWYRYKPAPVLIHYSLLGVCIVLALCGSMMLIDLFEPFSNFGRIVTNLIEPVFVSVNNAATSVLGRFGLFILFNIPLLHVTALAIVLALFFLTLIVYLAYYHGRLFCNMLCPAGAVLGLLSRFSLFRISIVEDRCTDCGFCEMVCKANCLDSNAKKIDVHACVGCFNCVDSCPTVALKYEGFRRKPATQEVPVVDPLKRAFLGSLLAGGSSMMLPRVDSTRVDVKPSVSYDESLRKPVTPPGSRSRDRFTNLCTACHLCISVCPPQVLSPSLFEYGIAGIMQPRLNYRANYCNYECVLCSQVCPTGAILPLDVAAKKEIQLGKATFVKDDCIVAAKKKDCGACSEHCPTKAVKMVPYEEKLVIPELNNDICVGCGACEHACPTTPRKAIYVVANAVHQKAKKPEVQKLENPLETQKDFPF